MPAYRRYRDALLLRIRFEASAASEVAGQAGLGQSQAEQCLQCLERNVVDHVGR